YIDWMKSCYLISAVGNPALAVPCAFTAGGLPVGLQIVGRHRDDWGVLQLGHAFEQATGLWGRRPPLARYGPGPRLQALRQRPPTAKSTGLPVLGFSPSQQATTSPPAARVGLAAVGGQGGAVRPAARSLHGRGGRPRQGRHGGG